MLRPHLQKFGSLLGLLAILLSTLAPVISQTLAAHERLDTDLHTLCSVSPTQAGHAARAGDPGAPLHLDACAYCGLAAHFAALLPPPVTPLAALLLVRTVRPAPRIAAPVLARDRTAQPRAPPALI